MEITRRPSRRLPRFARIIRARPKLFLSAALGIAVVIALMVLPAAAGLKIATRLLIGWDCGIALYLALACQLMARHDVAHIRRRAAMQDEGQTTILVLTSVAALASIGAIIAELGSSGGAAGRQPHQLILATLTIVLSWFFVHVMFALHYAHEYYSENKGRGGGMNFPGDEAPDYWDFVYFSFVIGMTSQVSDVAITCRPIRRTATAHGIVSFTFNAALVALTVNIAASAI
jgi:uncharacterized membrane protein